MNEHPRDLHAFALGDLTGDARAEIARHAAACARCRREIGLLQAEHATVVDALPPVPPSSAARERALAAAHTVVPAPAMLAPAAPAPAAPGAVPTPNPTASRRPPSPRTVTRRRPPAWAGWALASVVALAAVGVSWERHAAWRASESDRALVAGWLTRHDVTTWPLPAAPGSRSPGTVMVADDGVVLVVMRTPAPAGAAYRAWGIGPDGATALGDVPRTVLRAPAAGYDEVVVSLEPRAATSGPTGPLGAAPLPPAHDAP